MLTKADKAIWKLVSETVIPITVSVPTRLPETSCLSIDLHGLTIHQAHTETKVFLRDAWVKGIKRVVVITGRSGGIRQEFPVWMDQIPQVKLLEPLNGGGAFAVVLK